MKCTTLYTPGLWKHKRRPVQFTLIVDDFGVKYEGKEHVDHLLKALRKYYSKIIEDWKESLHADITLSWNYTERWLYVSMPGNVQKLRQRFWHKMPRKPEFSSFKAAPKVYGATAQNSRMIEELPLLDEKLSK